MKKESRIDTKKDRFARIAERRVNKLLNDLESLGKCANKKNYEYNQDDVKMIFQAIEKKLRMIKAQFRNSNEKKKSFSLRNR